MFLPLLFITPAVADNAPGRPWDLSIRAFVQYNDNVPLVAEETAFTGDKKSPQYGIAINGRYRFYQGEQWSSGIYGTISRSENTESNVDAFDHTNITPILYLTRTTAVWNRPATLSLNYSPRKDYLGSDSYETSHTLSAALSVKNNVLWSTDLGYSYADKDFDNEGTDPALTSRDSRQHSLSVNFTRQIPLWRTLSFGYRYTNNEAKGSNFDFDAHNFSLSFKTPLFSALLLEVSAAYSTQDYVHYTPEPRRSQDNQHYRFSLLYPLTRKMSMDATVNYDKYGGNATQFDATRSTTGIGLSYRF